MKRKWLVVGIILLFVGASVPVAGNSLQKKTDVRKDTPTIERTPENGFYWNNRKIMEYPALFYFHYYFMFKTNINIEFRIANGTVDRVDWYINGVKQATVTNPPYTFPCSFTVYPFSHTPTFSIKAYFNSGEILSDNVTVYRLFP